MPSFYSKELAFIISQMLQHNPRLRPSCLNMMNLINEKIYRKKTEEHHSTILSDDDLLKTIKFPKKVIEINKILPKPRYIHKRVKRYNEI